MFFRIFISICLFCLASFDAFSMEFSVQHKQDRMGVESVMSSDGDLFTKKGSAQILVYERDPFKRLGLICCVHNVDDSKEYFILGKNDEKYILQATMVKSPDVNMVGFNVFDVFGEKKASMKFTNKYAFNSISVARSKKYFGYYDGRYVRIYDSSLNEIRRYPTKIKSEAKLKLVLSYNANGYLLVGENQIYVHMGAKDISSDNESLCVNVLGKEVYFNSFENTDGRYVIVSQSGESCVINETVSEEFRVKIDAKVLGVYAKDESLYLVTSDSLSAFDLDLKLLESKFEVKPYYISQYGDSPYEKPFFIDHEFNSRLNEFYLRGSLSIKTLFEVMLIN